MDIKNRSHHASWTHGPSHNLFLFSLSLPTLARYFPYLAAEHVLSNYVEQIAFAGILIFLRLDGTFSGQPLLTRNSQHWFKAVVCQVIKRSGTKNTRKSNSSSCVMCSPLFKRSAIVLNHHHPLTNNLLRAQTPFNCNFLDKGLFVCLFSSLLIFCNFGQMICLQDVYNWFKLKAF